ncbi:MAG: hypothetical protein E6H06_03475 [Bacteroidetes bacterium]|nr:MAG: hypothetical protein E6H06_03475 [Bacteroidota bacterium]
MIKNLNEQFVCINDNKNQAPEENQLVLSSKSESPEFPVKKLRKAVVFPIDRLRGGVNFMQAYTTERVEVM